MHIINFALLWGVFDVTCPEPGFPISFVHGNPGPVDFFPLIQVLPRGPKNLVDACGNWSIALLFYCTPFVHIG